MRESFGQREGRNDETRDICMRLFMAGLFGLETFFGAVLFLATAEIKLEFRGKEEAKSSQHVAWARVLHNFYRIFGTILCGEMVSRQTGD
jgi:hypothetical protein